MILVDTSVWIDHLHHPEKALVSWLEHGEVLTHPMVTGELALGTLRSRAEFLDAIDDLPSATVANHHEVRHLVDVHQLCGRGLSFIDAHLIAATRLTPASRLWTRDRRLRAAADDLRLGLVTL